MSIEKVRAYLKNMNCPKEVIEFEQSSATVELAAQAAGVIPARITKTLCLMSKEGPSLSVLQAIPRLITANSRIPLV